MKKNTEIKTKRMKYEILITMRIIMYLSGQEREIKGKKRKERVTGNKPAIFG